MTALWTRFFDPNARTSPMFEMGGTGHLGLMLFLFALLGLLIAFRKDLPTLRDNRAFMAGGAGVMLALELLSYALTFAYPFERTFERIPLHLCASLKIAVAALILLKRYDLVKHISIWSIGAGFISFVNINLEGAGFSNFLFWHYLAGHCFLVFVPIFFFLTGDFRYDFGFHLRSMLGLAGWSLVIFCVNWKFDTNYMYTGPHNDTAVPFIPVQWMAWPLNYVSYLAVGVVLLSAVFAILKACQAPLSALRSGVAGEALP